MRKDFILLDFIFLILLAVVLVLAARYDRKTKHIPNFFPACAAVIAVCRVVTGANSIQSALIGAAGGAIPALLLYLFFHCVGKGDIKLLAACGAAIGGMDAAGAVIFSYASLYIFFFIQKLRRQKALPVAFGPFIAVGCGLVIILNMTGVITSA